MKIRTGFVSNSSSSSFVVYGVEMPKDEFEKLSGEFNDAYEFGLKFDLQACLPEDSDVVMIGLSPFDMDDDETMGQFKKRAAATLEKALGAENMKKYKPDFICEVVYG